MKIKVHPGGWLDALKKALFPPPPKTIEQLRSELTPEERKFIDELVMNVWRRYDIHLLPSEEKRRWYTKEFVQSAMEHHRYVAQLFKEI